MPRSAPRSRRETNAGNRRAARAGRLVRPGLAQRESGEIDEGDAAGERLGRLPQHFRRSAAEHQKAGGTRLAVGEHPQDGKQIGPALHLVEHHEPAEISQGLHGLGENREVGGILQVEKQGAASLGGELAGEGGLAALARTEQRDDRVARQGGSDGRSDVGAWDGRFHVPRIFEVPPRKCKEVIWAVFRGRARRVPEVASGGWGPRWRRR
jgi:hypothetical protein